jgi:hypothetical protein
MSYTDFGPLSAPRRAAAPAPAPIEQPTQDQNAYDSYHTVEPAARPAAPASAVAAPQRWASSAELDPDDLVVERRLGGGAFGDVLYGHYGSVEVAVKQLKPPSSTVLADEDVKALVAQQRASRAPTDAAPAGEP